MLARAFLASALLAVALAFSPSAGAVVADGPRLAFVEWLAQPPMTRLATVGADGAGRRTLALDGVQPAPYAGPAFSPDGSTLVFAGYPVNAAGEARENARTWLYAVGSEGGAARRLPGTVGARGPVLSPDGGTVAFQRVRIRNRYDRRHPLESGVTIRASAWTVPTVGGQARQLTPWSRGLEVRPASYSPDGSMLLLERDRGAAWNPEVVALEMGRRSLRVVATAAEQPAYSPDGTRIALVSYRDGIRRRGQAGPEPVAELYILDADGTRPRRLTRTPGQHESQPAWSLDGARLAFLRVRAPVGLGFGSTLMQANADGTCARRVTGSRGPFGPAIYGPAWQPGLGREAAALGC